MTAVAQLQAKLQELDARRPDAIEARQSRDVDIRAHGIAALEILDEDKAELLAQLEVAQLAETAEAADRAADQVGPTLGPLHASLLEDLADLAEAVSKLRSSSAAYTNVVGDQTLKLHQLATGSERIRASHYSTVVDGVQLRTYQNETAGAVARIVEPLFRQLGSRADDLKFMGTGAGPLPANPFTTEDEKTVAA